MNNLSRFPQNYFHGGTDGSRVRNIFRILAISMAGLHTWAAIVSQSMNADGISYLDIGDAYFRGDWANAINPVWPPLYSWMLGLVNFVFKPSMAWQFPTVHILDFVVFLGALACFEFMWKKLRVFSKESLEAGHISLSGWAWWAVGYSLFIWISLSLIQIWAVTPDMLMAGLLCLAAGLIIQIRMDPFQWRAYIYLGLILGFGYLAKTFMFSIALVFLGICLLLVGRTRGALARITLSTGLFLLVCLPFILFISKKVGHLSIGEAGTVTYLRHVQGIPFAHWQGDPARNIVLDHPSRLINQSPPIYEFGTPIGGTYPIATDPSYWYEGINLPFNFSNQLARIFISALYYLELFFQKQGILVACVAALYFMGARQSMSLTNMIHRWALVFPAVIAFGLYGLVLVSGRYIGIFILLFWTDILANISLNDTVSNRYWLKTLSSIAVLGVLVNILLFNLDGINRLNPSIRTNINEPVASKPAGPLEVAQFLQSVGVKEGDRVAVIGYGYDSFWARLARVNIVAEMPGTQAEGFWQGDDVLQKEVLQAFASTGARLVVAESVPDNAHLDGWLQVGKSNYYIYRLRK